MSARWRRWLDRLLEPSAVLLRQARRVLTTVTRWRGQPLTGSLPLDEAFLERLERLQIAAHQVVRQGLIGEHKSRRKATSLEFADYRHYAVGDDFRRIDWNAYGRLEELFLKLTEAKEDVVLNLLIDCSRSMDWGQPKKLDYARQVAAALGYIALARFDGVVAAGFSHRLHAYLPVTRGKGRALTLFAFLNALQPGTTTDFDLALAEFCQRLRPRGVCVLISDLFTARGLDGGLDQLARHGLETVVIHLLDPAELRPPFRGDLELVDMETGEQLEVSLGSEALHSYQQRLAAWCAEVEAVCRRWGARYLRVDTGVPFERLVVHYLRARGVVQ